MPPTKGRKERESDCQLSVVSDRGETEDLNRFGRDGSGNEEGRSREIELGAAIEPLSSDLAL